MLFFKYLPGLYQGADHTGRRVLNIDSGGGSQPTQTSTVSIPEYAKPYMEKTLGQAEALTQAPYQVYEGERFAGPTYAQQAARAEATGLQTPGQFDVATGLTGAGGLQALSAGRDYMGMATDPYAVSAFMSPYMQNVVDVQKQAALRETQQAQQAQNLAAGRREGALTGAAAAIGQAERERGLLNRMGEIQALGSQKAYEDAIKSLQFGSELGLKGAQAGAAAGEGLAKIGATEQAADLERLKFQEAMGSLTQADQQRLLDLQYQDFLAQQRYPYEQIGFMSDLLRGSGSLAKNTGVYDAPASPLQQIVGPGLLGLGIYKEFIS